MGTGSVFLRFPAEPAGPRSRVQIGVRFIFGLIVAVVLFRTPFVWVAYLGLPALAAATVAQRGGERYLTEIEPRIARVLRWLARAFAYMWLLTDEPPTTDEVALTDLEIEPGGAPTPGSALLRVLYSVPAFLVFVVITIGAAIFWLVGAIAILATGRLPLTIAEYLSAALRYRFKLIAYHLSLVDRYPAIDELGIPRPAAGPSR